MKIIANLIQLAGIIFFFLFFLFPINIIGGVLILILGSVLYNKEVKRIKQERNLIECPFCKEKIQPNAIKCKHCGSDLTTETNNETKEV